MRIATRIAIASSRSAVISDESSMVLSVARTALAVTLLAAFARGQVTPCREYQLSIGGGAAKKWREAHLLRGPKTVTCRLRLRGTAKNRNYTLELPRVERIAPAIEARKVYLLNLGKDDPHGFELRFCTDVARRLGLFPSHAQFARVAINGGKPRLYLQVERPEDVSLPRRTGRRPPQGRTRV